jgi:hypothetical protein
VLARLPGLPLGVADLGDGIAGAAEALRRCHRQGAEPGPVRRSGRAIAGPEPVVRRRDGRLDVIAHRRATAMAPLPRAPVGLRERALVWATARPRRLQGLAAS